ncbi:MAG: hypothetical protein AAF740_01420 [Bacteroidota bacterium]
MRRILYFLFFFVYLSNFISAQNNIRGAKVEAQGALTLTIAVINSDKSYHVAAVRYYNEKGELILNTNEEFRIDISKASRFATGSVKKTVPMYSGAHSIRVDVSDCTNMHENEFLLSEAEAANNEVTFVFRTEVEDLVRVVFKGIQADKPGAFNIRGLNTNIIYYADYDGIVKVLPDEARISDIKVDLSSTTLHSYRVVSQDIDSEEQRMEVQLEYIGENPNPTNTSTAKKSEEPSTEKKKKKRKKNKNR